MLRVTMAMQTDDRGGLVISWGDGWRDSGKTQRLQSAWPSASRERSSTPTTLAVRGGDFCTFNAEQVRSFLVSD